MAAGATTIDALRRENASLREENEELRRALERQREKERAPAALTALEEEVTSLRAENDRLKKVLQALEEHLALLRAKRFGRRSEKGLRGQLTLFDLEAAEGSEEERAEETITYTRKKPRRAPARQGFPEHLARNEYAVDPPEEERVCECCESELVRIRSEVTERGDVIPPRVVINRYVRGVWGCRNGCVPPKVADLPPSVVPKTKWEPSAYAYVAVAKYGDHVPLHRQSAIFRRHGIEMPKSTLCDMALAAAEAIRPVVREMAREVRKSEVLLADETPIRVAVEEEDGRKGRRGKKKRKFRTGYLWVYRSPDGEKIAFDFRTNRSRAGPMEFLGDWRGTLLTDEYSGYDEVCRRNGLVRAACWAHARRRFREAEESRRPEAQEAVRLIGRLFALERLAGERIDRLNGKRRERGADPLSRDEEAEVRLAVRRRWSAGIVSRLKARLLGWMRDSSILPKSVLGGAVRYLLPEGARREGVWERFTVFLRDGRVPLDNNAAENAIRPSVVGRKNWLFAGSTRGGETAAAMYGLLLTCRALGVNPEEYLSDVLSRLDRDPPAALTPWAWKRENEARAAQAAAFAPSRKPLPS